MKIMSLIYFFTLLILFIICSILVLIYEKPYICKIRLPIKWMLELFLLIIFISFIMTDTIMFRFKTPEEAYQYASGGDVIFKKEINNFAFVMGGSHNREGLLQYYDIKKEKSGWRILRARYDVNRNKVCLLENNVYLKAYIMSDDDEKIHGIFVIPLDAKEKQVKEFSDSRGNAFSIIHYEEKRIGNKRNKQPIFFGLVKGKITKDYFIQINNTKYYLGKYSKGCVG